VQAQERRTRGPNTLRGEDKATPSPEVNHEVAILFGTKGHNLASLGGHHSKRPARSAEKFAIKKYL